MDHVVFHAPVSLRPSDLLRKKLGCKGRQIGSGAYANVFWSPSLKRVVKIGDLDDPYLGYVNSIKISRPSPFFPKIDKLVECFEAGSDWEDREGSYAIVMERLYPARSSKQEDLLDLVCGLIDDYDSEITVHDALKYVVRNKVKATDIKRLLKVSQRIVETAEDVGADLDMHDGNVMFRKNGQIVITDPFC